MNDNYELPKMVENENTIQEVPATPVETKKEYEDSLKGMFKYITTQDTKELFMVLLRLAIIALIIVVFHLPVSLIKELGINILTLLNVTLSDSLLNIWYFVCEGIYFIIAIVLFFKLVKTRYQQLIIKKG